MRKYRIAGAVIWCLKRLRYFRDYFIDRDSAAYWRGWHGRIKYVDELKAEIAEIEAQAEQSGERKQ